MEYKLQIYFYSLSKVKSLLEFCLNSSKLLKMCSKITSPSFQYFNYFQVSWFLFLHLLNFEDFET